MTSFSEPEVWLRGPIGGISPLLQPVAHSLLQCREELRAHVSGLTAREVCDRAGHAPSIGFHLQHAARSLDRLFTYARGEQLSPVQRAVLAAEGQGSTGGGALLAEFENVLESALEQLRATSEAILLERREVGRKRLPSNVLGLLFHAAEHTQRHVGQITTTVSVLKGLSESAGER